LSLLQNKVHLKESIHNADFQHLFLANGNVAVTRRLGEKGASENGGREASETFRRRGGEEAFREEVRAEDEADKE